MNAPLRIALIGFGKIAQDQHVAAIAAHPDLQLAAVVSRYGKAPAGVPQFATTDELLASGLPIDAWSHCNTPSARFLTALAGLQAGHHTLIEKPPTATLTQANALLAQASRAGVSIMTAWHSQHNEAVLRARDWLADKSPTSLLVTWRESVRKWHPGQTWIWQPGGFGVFDPGINALSIVTRIMPVDLHVTHARLEVPANCHTPIAAQVTFAGPGLSDARAVFDFLGDDNEEWTIDITCPQGRLRLESGGRRLFIDGALVLEHGDREYASIYRDFADAIAAGRHDYDLAPLTHVADAFLLGERVTVEAFVE